MLYQALAEVGAGGGKENGTLATKNALFKNEVTKGAKK
jgi:hypothetical protein